MNITAKPAGRSVAAWRARLASTTPLACIAVLGTVALAACGSSKPAYCSARTNLQNSSNTLRNSLANYQSGQSTSNLQSQAQTVRNDANTLVNDATKDFPSETSAISASINTLASAVRALPPNPTSSQLAQVRADAQNVRTAVQNFYNTSNSKCS
jgi:K+-sensing histidine kinase KdpD